jgi:hypothetical protein
VRLLSIDTFAPTDMLMICIAPAPLPRVRRLRIPDRHRQSRARERQVRYGPGSCESLSMLRQSGSRSPNFLPAH